MSDRAKKIIVQIRSPVSFSVLSPSVADLSALSHKNILHEIISEIEGIFDGSPDLGNYTKQ